MKKKIYKMIQGLGLSIISYRTYRSDMGCQVYEVYVTNGIKNEFYNDGYFVGQQNGADYILKSLRDDVLHLTL